MSISTSLQAFNEHYRQIQEFKSILPDPEDVLEENGRYYIQAVIPRSVAYSGDYREYLQHVWRDLYHKMTMKIARLMMGFDGYTVVKMEPIVMPMIDDGWKVAVVSDIGFAKDKQVIIPTFIYDEFNRPIEWRCGHCGMPNPIEARYCGEMFHRAAGCGAPRTLLTQEIR